MRTAISSERLHSAFVHKVEEISGQKLAACYQCGKCSAGCPVASAMDLLPHQVIRFAQLGLEEDVAGCRAIWVCASCLTCSVRCPRGVDLARVMEALRLLTLRKNVNHVEPSALSRGTVADLPQLAIVSGFRKFTG